MKRIVIALAVVVALAYVAYGGLLISEHQRGYSSVSIQSSPEPSTSTSIPPQSTTTVLRQDTTVASLDALPRPRADCAPGKARSRPNGPKHQRNDCRGPGSSDLGVPRHGGAGG